MKPPIDSATIAAIAAAAFLAHNAKYSDAAPDVRYPERIAGDPLGLNDLIRDKSREVSDVAVEVFDSVLAFGLQAGALIGADPLHLPDLKDLISQYRLKPKAKAA